MCPTVAGLRPLLELCDPGSVLVQGGHPCLGLDQGAGLICGDAAVLQADLQGALVHLLALTGPRLHGNNLLQHHLERAV